MEEVKFVISQLQTVLGQDNDARKGAEAALAKIREGEPDKYAGYLTAVIMEAEAPADIKALASVILRRGLTTALPNKKETLWEALTPGAKDFLKTNLLSTIRSATTKDLMHKLSNLLVEVQGGMHDQNQEVWQELLGLCFEFVKGGNDTQVDAALQIFNGLFSYIIDHFNKYQSDLL